MYNKCFVACLDILGFKSLVNQTYPDTQIYVYDAYIIVDMLRRFKKLSEILTGANDKNTCPKIHSLLISDTLLLFSENDDEPSFKYICGIIAETICAGTGLSTTDIATPGTPMRFRGAISWGDFYCDEKQMIFFGPAFIDAYQWERKQEWIGAILTPTCANYVIKQGYKIDKYGIVEYDAPIKTETIEDNKSEITIATQKCFCLDWTHEFECEDVTPDKALKQLSIDNEANNKLKYTKNFYIFLRNKLNEKKGN